MSLVSRIQFLRRSALHQFIIFAAVGGAATITHAAVALAAHKYFDQPPLLANLFGYVFAVLISYCGNAKITFKQQTANIRQFSRFTVVSLAALALNQASLFIFMKILKAPFAFALIPAVTIVPIFSFAASRLWAFGTPRSKLLGDGN